MILGSSDANSNVHKVHHHSRLVSLFHWHISCDNIFSSKRIQIPLYLKYPAIYIFIQESRHITPILDHSALLYKGFGIFLYRCLWACIPLLKSKEQARKERQQTSLNLSLPDFPKPQAPYNHILWLFKDKTCYRQYLMMFNGCLAFLFWIYNLMLISLIHHILDRKLCLHRYCLTLIPRIE